MGRSEAAAPSVKSVTPRLQVAGAAGDGARELQSGDARPVPLQPRQTGGEGASAACVHQQARRPVA
eukprot:scaffold14805_cov121-Isochrysis_galbana.AAC.5